MPISDRQRALDRLKAYPHLQANSWVALHLHHADDATVALHGSCDCSSYIDLELRLYGVTYVAGLTAFARPPSSHFATAAERARVPSGVADLLARAGNEFVFCLEVADPFLTVPPRADPRLAPVALLVADDRAVETMRRLAERGRALAGLKGA